MEAAPEEHAEDLESLFAEVNHLPADDPLRDPGNQGPAMATSDSAEFRAQGTEHSDGPGKAAAQSAANAGPQRGSAPATGSVAVANQRVAVPSFAGKSLREVVVQASSAGLGVRIVGSGIAREQAPAAGTLVPAGAEIVVRFEP
jgi:cell division protein FtsI (penicillin-binding protein 3)